MTIPVKGVEQLRRLAQRCGSSLFVTVLAAFKVLLRRYSGRDDLVVGTPSSGRNRPDLEGGLVGCFVNLTALRTDMTGSKLSLMLFIVSWLQRVLVVASVMPGALQPDASETVSCMHERHMALIRCSLLLGHSDALHQSFSCVWKWMGGPKTPDIRPLPPADMITQGC